MMQRQLKDGVAMVLAPGEYYATQGEEVISTLLGSCIAVCLYDPLQGVRGMNHFLLASQRFSKTMKFTDSDAGRYGVHYMELLINSLLKLGAKKKNLQAKAFGGAAVLDLQKGADNFMCIGEVNVRFAKEFLRAEKIPLHASDLGGTQGRMIYFFQQDYTVLKKNIARNQTEVITEKERHFWKSSIHHQADSNDGVDLWD